MSKFVTGKELTDVIYDIIWNAEQTLLLVSPFIKLDDYFKKLLNNHINNHKVHLIVVFGKNETNVSKSLTKDDFKFFQQFMNVSIVYVPNLHAKYYANELKGVITSINLHDFSFKNNVEYGVYFEATILNSITSKTDIDAWDSSYKLAEESEAVFIKRPVYEKKLIFGKNYVKSDILHDTTEQFYGFKKKSAEFKKLVDFPDELELGSKKTVMPTREEVENEVKKSKPTNNVNTGFCIRTGNPIPYNPSRPYSESAYKSWAQYSNWDFKESYCHKTGKPSFGKTSMRKPIL